MKTANVIGSDGSTIVGTLWAEDGKWAGTDEALVDLAEAVWPGGPGAGLDELRAGWSNGYLTGRAPLTALSTFDEARAAAIAWALPSWDQESRGTLHALDSGQEDPWFYRVVLGAAEFLVGDDWSYMAMDEPVVLVEKSTGKVYPTDFAAAEAGLSRMIPCGMSEIQSPAPAARRRRASVAGRVRGAGN